MENPITNAPGVTRAENDITLLHLNTGATIIDRVEELLSDEYGSIRVVVEDSPADVLERIGTTSIDCVISGTEMEGIDSLEFFRQVRERDAALPLIFYKTDEDEAYITEAISIGADDVIEPGERTDRTELLAQRITTLVSEYRTKRRLRESNRRFDTLVSNLPGMVYRCRNEPGWPLMYASEGAEELTGYTPEELTDGDLRWGDDVMDTADRDRVWADVQKAIENGEPYQVDYRIVTADGDRRWVWEQGRAVEENGEHVALEGFITDVTDRKRQSRRIAVLNRVLRHNLRNRMNVILSHASHVESTSGGDEREHTDKIRETARGVAELSSSVADIESIIQAADGDLTAVNLTRSIERVVDELRAEFPDADLSVEYDHSRWASVTDQFSLVVRQAVKNGIVHNDSETPAVTVEIRDGESDGTVEVSVRDNGPGIRSMELEILDDHSEITDLSHGSGLGLWVMRWFVDAVDGDLSFSDCDPTGTEVTFTFQRAEPSAFD